MIEEEWLTGSEFETLFYYLEEMGVLTQRKLRLFEVACCRRFAPLLTNADLNRALIVAEGFADGEQTAQQLAAAHEAAREIESESATPDGEQDEYVYYGAKAVLEVTSPDHTEYSAGTLDVLDHVVETIAYAMRPYDRTQHEKWLEHAGEVSVTAKCAHILLLRDTFGNPFRPVTFSPEWRTSTTVAVASQMYESRDFGAMPILADALQDAGCDSADVLDHCRAPGVHVRGCGVVDLVLDKQ